MVRIINKLQIEKVHCKFPIFHDSIFQSTSQSIDADTNTTKHVFDSCNAILTVFNHNNEIHYCLLHSLTLSLSQQMT